MAKSTSKTHVNIEWPDGHFTITKVQEKYPDVVNITLRFRVTKAEEAGQIVLIGKIKPKIGRPNKVYSKANPTKELLDSAKAAGVLLLSEEGTSNVPSIGEVKIESAPTQVAAVKQTESATSKVVA